jgi:hypothetical protein
LINITHKDSARTKWLLTAHIVSQYTDALCDITTTYAGTWSDRHKEMNPSSVKQDHQDLLQFVPFLQHHNPVTVTNNDVLKNVATDVIADERGNAYEAVKIGQAVHERLNDQKLGDVVLKKADKVTTFAVMRKAVHVVGEEVKMSPAELYHRLLSAACTGGPPDPSVFSHELTTTAPALFNDDGSMRRSAKSALARHVFKLHPDKSDSHRISSIYV